MFPPVTTIVCKKLINTHGIFGIPAQFSPQTKKPSDPTGSAFATKRFKVISDLISVEYEFDFKLLSIEKGDKKIVINRMKNRKYFLVNFISPIIYEMI